MTGKREHSLPGKAGKLLECQRMNQHAHPGISPSLRNTHTHYGRSLTEHEVKKGQISLLLWTLGMGDTEGCLSVLKVENFR